MWPASRRLPDSFTALTSGILVPSWRWLDTYTAYASYSIRRQSTLLGVVGDRAGRSAASITTIMAAEGQSADVHTVQWNGASGKSARSWKGHSMCQGAESHRGGIRSGEASVSRASGFSGRRQLLWCASRLLERRKGEDEGEERVRRPTLSMSVCQALWPSIRVPSSRPSSGHLPQ